MNRTRAVTATLLLAILAGGASTIAANPLQHPKRVVGGQTVDLSPLFKWWKNKGKDRPLPGWVHVTGSVTGTNMWGWIITGHADTPADSTTPNNRGKFILRNPPLDEYAKFQTLSAELKNLQAQKSQVSADEKQAANNATKASQRPRYGRRAILRERQARQARQNEEADKEQLQEIDKQIAAVKKRLAEFPSADHFALDCFALDMHQARDGMAVFDHGMVFY